MIRARLLAFLIALSPQAFAQQPLALTEVQRLAPHLLAFTGSPANFESLITGLSQGGTVTLNTPFQDGTTEIASFTATVPLAPNDIVTALERARITLAGMNIVQPSAAQLGAALAGGTVDTALARAQLPGVLPRVGVAPGVQAQRFIMGAPGTLPAPLPGQPAVAGGLPGTQNAPAFPSQTPGFASSGGSFPSQAPGMIVNPAPGMPR